MLLNTNRYEEGKIIATMINIPNMILIGSTARNSGKTTLAVSIIERYKNEMPVYAIKITTIAEKNGKCIHGGSECGVCSNLKDNYEITEEKKPDGIKDTSLLLASGACQVYWLKVIKEHLSEGIKAVISQISENALIVCESNSLRKVVNPGFFVIVKNTQVEIIKKSASEVWNQADFVFENYFTNDFEEIINEIDRRMDQN